MDTLKKYFETPKMPFSFYYTPYTIVYIVKFLYMFYQGTYSMFDWIFNIVVFILGSYTYAWLSDYMLFSSENTILHYFFAKSVVFRRDFGTVLKVSYVNNSKHKVHNIKNGRISEAHEVYLKRTFVGLIINIIVKFILAWLFIWVFWISIFTHPFIMKKYKEKVKMIMSQS